MANALTLLTPKQAERRKRDEKICSAFKSLRKKYPEASLERIFFELSKDYGLTSLTIRKICKDAEVC